MRAHKLNDTSKVINFYMVDSTDHGTPETGLTLTVQVSKNGGTFAAVSGSVAEVGNGFYKLTPAAADVNTLGPAIFRATATGADPCPVEKTIVAFDPYTVANLGLSNLDVASSTLATAANLSTANTNISTLATRLSAARAGYLDNLNVIGTLANTDNASSFMANITSLATGASLAQVAGDITTLINRLTSARAGYLDNLNVTGTLANTDNASSFMADVSGLAEPGDEMNLADGALTAAKIATDAISAAKIAADAIAEIQSGLSTHSAADVKTAIEAAGSMLKFCRDVLEADATIDTTATPWQFVLKIKSTDTELARKDLKDINAANISAITTVIASQTEPT